MKIYVMSEMTKLLFASKYKIRMAVKKIGLPKRSYYSQEQFEQIKRFLKGGDKT